MWFKKIKNFMSSNIIINGNSYTGNNVSIINGKIIIDGNDVTPDSKTITIDITGNLGSLKADVVNKVSITGNVDGDVQIGTGDVQIGTGDVQIGSDVHGNIKTGVGDIKVQGNVSGNAKTGVGDIKYSK